MLHFVKPNRKKSKDGGLTKKEQSFVKGLLDEGYSAQDIVHIINQGRSTTINLARVTEAKNNKDVKASSKKEIDHFIEVQSSYDPKTLLNPYRDERLIRAREAMISAVQIFNSPTIIFKAEIFCVLANIAWTYLFHEKVERTVKGSSVLDSGKSITVSGTLDKDICPIKDNAVKENIKKIIEIRDAVEHTFFVGGEGAFGSLFQANCVNFERYLTEWFGENLSLAKELSLALQFVRLKKEQVITLETSNFPPKIKAISKSIHDNEFSDNNAFQLTVFYTTDISSKTNADLHKLVDYDAANEASVVAVKKQNYTKLSETEVVGKIKKKGYKNFSEYEHRLFWKSRWAAKEERNKKATKFGEVVLKNQWQWYEETWLGEVLQYCKAAGNKYK